MKRLALTILVLIGGLFVGPPPGTAQAESREEPGPCRLDGAPPVGHRLEN
jgi:hypothetical protein